MRKTLLALTVLSAGAALASDPQPPPAQVAQRHHALSPFERTFGLGAYATGWHGAYGGAGVGGRLRVELTSWLGTDFFGEALFVTTPTGLRHDHPIGFNLYVPLRLGAVRLRPLLGMCVVLSLIEPGEPEAPRADDVLVGAHAGAGVELALHSRLSFFAEAKAVVWLGHDRAVHGWTGVVDNEVRPFVVGQANLGFTFHLGGP